MDSRTDDRIAAVLAAAPDIGAAPGGHTALAGGTYNTLFRIRLAAHGAGPDGGGTGGGDPRPAGGGPRPDGGGTDGGGPDSATGPALVLKLPPPASAPALTYERELLCGEAEFYTTAARDPRVPVPRVVASSLDDSVTPGGYVLMTECPGRPWHVAAADAPTGPAERTRLRRELGAAVARLHALRGPFFGYPSGAVPTAPTWRAAFGAMLEAVLADAARFAYPLPMDPRRVRTLLAAAAPALDEVTVPALVHFDLWEGNVLLAGPPGARRLGGLIDGERMFWGDPLADLASLNLLGGPGDDPALLDGYRAAGGTLRLDGPALLRCALYRAYLGLIMLVESVPRGYGPARTAETQAAVVPWLTEALGFLAARTGGSG